MKIKEDMTGKVFGRLTITGRDFNKIKKDDGSYWNCLCSCGYTKSISRASLVKGNTKSCGCLRDEKAIANSKKGIGISKPIKEDLTGKVFEKLTVLKRDTEKIGEKRGSWWICQCECGIIKSISRKSIINDGIKSCGCYQITSARNSAIPNAGADKNYWIKKYKARAKNQNVEFSFTDKEFYDICSMNCFYCDAEPISRSHGYKRHNDSSVYKANGIDRVEPKKGYYKENSVPCCTICNLMKTDKSQKEFIGIAIRIADKHGRKNGS